jgi:hypothetical protein
MSDGVDPFGQQLVSAYVHPCRWAEEEESAGKPIDNRDYTKMGWDEWNNLANRFYGSEKAKSYYEMFVKNMVTHMVNHHKDLIHSWDICNEPRFPDHRLEVAKQNARQLTEWLHSVAKKVKEVDPNTPVTCGSEGFFQQGSSKCLVPWWLGAGGADTRYTQKCI